MAVAKLVILQRLTALLETVSPDLVGRVYRGRRNPPIEDAMDAMSILEQPRAVFGDPAGVEGIARKAPWTLNVQGWPVEDVDHPSDPAYEMAAKVEQCLRRVIATNREDGQPTYPEDFMLGRAPCMTAFEVGESIVVPATEGLSRVAFFYIPISITLART